MRVIHIQQIASKINHVPHRLTSGPACFDISLEADSIVVVVLKTHLNMRMNRLLPGGNVPYLVEESSR